jgi:hypothetical protein
VISASHEAGVEELAVEIGSWTYSLLSGSTKVQSWMIGVIRDLAATCSQAARAVVHAKAIPLIVSVLSSVVTGVQAPALDCLILVTMLFKDAMHTINEAKATLSLIPLLTSPSRDIQENAMACIGAVAVFSPSPPRDLMETNAMEALFTFFMQSSVRLKNKLWRSL